MTRELQPVLMGSLDYVWDRVRGRVDGMADDEYLWEPVAGCWTVRGGAIDRVVPDPDPAPVTTIAWRMWHIAAECLDGYSERLFGATGLGLGERQWYDSADDARAGSDRAWAVFRDGLGALGEDGLWQPLGAGWGPYADDTVAALVLHAQDEISHHGAEISLQRDLYLKRPLS